MFDESMGFRWWSLPADEAPSFGDLPDAGKALEVSGKEDWAARQREKYPLADGLDAIGKPERALALRNCCRSLVVHRYERGRVVQSLTECRDLVCPTGMKARSRRLHASTCEALEDYLRENPGMQGVMVTLTFKNCAAHELKSYVGQLVRACGELMQRKAVKRAVRAWMRSIELTRNSQTGEFHLHAHGVWFVERATYFKRGSDEFITQEKLALLWQKQMRLDYRPIVDIRPLRGVSSPLGEEGRKSLREVLKYVLKPGTLIEHRHGRPCLVGAESVELYDAGDGQGLREMKCVPLRAVCDALKSRRLVATSRNLQNEAELDFTDDQDVARAPAGNLGRFLCTEFYGWRVRGRQGGFFLMARTFDPPAAKGGFAMGP